LLREIIELPSGGSKRVFDRHLNMFVPLVVRRRISRRGTVSEMWTWKPVP